MVAESKMRVAEENLADVKSRVDERIEECERRCKESVAEHKEIDAQVLDQWTEYYEQELTKNGCIHCKCDRCKARALGLGPRHLFGARTDEDIARLAGNGRAVPAGE